MTIVNCKCAPGHLKGLLLTAPQMSNGVHEPPLVGSGGHNLWPNSFLWEHMACTDVLVRRGNWYKQCRDQNRKWLFQKHPKSVLQTINKRHSTSHLRNTFQMCAIMPKTSDGKLFFTKITIGRPLCFELKWASVAHACMTLRHGLHGSTLALLF